MSYLYFRKRLTFVHFNEKVMLSFCTIDKEHFNYLFFFTQIANILKE